MTFKQIMETIGVTIILLGLVLMTEPDEEVQRPVSSNTYVQMN